MNGGPGGDLLDRAHATLRAGNPRREISELASDLLRTESAALACKVLLPLLRSDPRFAVEGDLVTLARADCPFEDMPIEQVPIAVIDFETAGASSPDRAIEVGVACLRGGKEEASFETLLDPGIPLSPFVIQLTGIRPEDLRGKPPFRSIWPGLRRQLDGRALAAHNLPFDFAVLKGEVARCAGDAFRPPARLCTLKLARRLVPKPDSRSLDALAERFGLRFSSRHRALDDARVAGQLLYRLVELLREQRDLPTWGHLLAFLDAKNSTAPRPPKRSTK